MGEFGLAEVLKQFLDETKATPVSDGWDGDRYVVYENKQSKKLLLITRLRLATEQDREHFFATYSQAFAKKYDKRSGEVRDKSFLSFNTPDGNVFFRCVERECATREGGDRTLFDKLNKEMDWTVLPQTAKEPATPAVGGRAAD